MDGREAFQRLAAEAQSGELVFPTHAYVALRVRMTLDDPDLHIDEAAKAVQAEPLLSARVVSIANSIAFNRSGRPISDVRSAVVRLGISMVRSLATALVIRQMSAAPTAPSHQALAARLWEHTSHVAALAYVLARRVSRQNPDIAMFAGIVHEVGGFYLLSRAAAYPGLLDDGVDAAWAAGGEALLGTAVLAALAVPPEVAAAVHGLWEGGVVLPPATLSDTLFLANCLTPIANPLQTAAGVHHDEMLAVSTQVMADQSLAAVIEESVDELDSLASTLKF